MINFTPLTAAALAAAVFAGPTSAEVAVSLPLHLGPNGGLATVEYTCADGTGLIVQYVNAKVNGLALIPLKGDEVIFVNVISGSGARYVAGARSWWVKGDEATLNDEMSKAEPLTCVVKGASAEQ